MKNTRKTNILCYLIMSFSLTGLSFFVALLITMFFYNRDDILVDSFKIIQLNIIITGIMFTGCFLLIENIIFKKIAGFPITWTNLSLDQKYEICHRIDRTTHSELVISNGLGTNQLVEFSEILPEGVKSGSSMVICDEIPSYFIPGKDVNVLLVSELKKT